MKCDCGSFELADGEPPPHHDCDYVTLRNDLIPQAEAIANGQCGGRTTGKQSEEWTRCFSAAMDRLSKELLNGASNGSKEAR